MNPPLEVAIENIEDQINYLESFNYIANNVVIYTYQYEIDRLIEVVNKIKNRWFEMDKDI